MKIKFFSLTELVLILIVFAVTGTLTLSLADHASGASVRTSCSGNLRRIGEALNHYSADNQDFLCPNIVAWWSGKKCYRTDFWQDILSARYMDGDWSFFSCTEELLRRNTDPVTRPPEGTFPYTGSYARYRPSTGFLNYGRADIVPAVPLSAVRNPGESASAADCASDQLEFLTPAHVTTSGKYCLIARKRHEGYFNLLYLDAHVETLSSCTSKIWKIDAPAGKRSISAEKN